jgi:hypothetical protein
MATFRTDPGYPTPFTGNTFRFRLMESADGLSKDDRALMDHEIVDPPKERPLLLGPAAAPTYYMRRLKVRLDRLRSGATIPGRITVTIRFHRSSK